MSGISCVLFKKTIIIKLKFGSTSDQSLCRDWKLYWSVLVYLLTTILVTDGYQLIMNAELLVM